MATNCCTIEVTPNCIPIIDVIVNPVFIPATGISPAKDDLVITVDGAITFTLYTAPLLPEITTLFLNGVLCTYDVDFVVTGAVLNWIADDITLEVVDKLTAYYYY
jgi:hypothetical protein